MRKSLNIAVMLGGPSAEREVSLRSGASVSKALQSFGHSVTEIDPNGPQWMIPLGTDVVFLALHGSYGEDGTVQADLDDLGVPYTGCDAESSRVAFDKVLTKQRCLDKNVPTATFAVIRSINDPWPKNLQPPCVLKPVHQGSSVGLHFIDRVEQFRDAVADAFKYDNELLLEQRIIGRETTVGILKDKALPIVEVRPKKGAYDYTNKYTAGATEYLCPAPFDSKTTAHIQEAGLQAFRAIGGRDYGRVDVMVGPDDQPVVLEVNTLPGMTETSLLPKAAAAAGYSYNDLCQAMIDLGHRTQKLMFGFLKSTNKKRGEKREMLNVKQRSGKVKAQRVRFVSVLLGLSISVSLLLTLGIKGIQYVMREGVYKNPNLAIDRIEVETDGVVSHDKIREWARVKFGDNLLALDLTRLKRDLELRPIVESATAEKILPRTLRISITERRPLAVVYLYGGGLDRVYLDSHGIVIPPLRNDERNPAADPNPSALPVLTGFNARELRPGRTVDSPHIHAALDLLAQHDRSPVALQTDFRSIDLLQSPTLLVKTDQNIEITFSTDNFPRQLARLQSALDLGRRQNRTLATLDLAVGNYVPVRWAEPTTNALPSTPLVPQLKPKKKHV